MVMSSADFSNRTKRHAKAIWRRHLISTSVLLAYHACLVLIAHSLSPRDVTTWPIVVFLLLLIAAIIAGYIGWFWYLLRSVTALQREYGLLCANCDTSLISPIRGRPQIVDGKCLKCHSQIIDDAS